MSFWSWLVSIFRKKPKPTIAPGVNRALLVGINAYTSAPLSGCVNDVDDMKQILISKYGFVESDIVVLKDRDATTQDIRNKIPWLYEATGKAYFHYSGHGVQVPDNDEADGLAEAICPIDFDWSPERMLTDNQLVELMKGIKAGVRFNWCSDSCHSGDLDRSINPHVKIPRTIAFPAHIAEIIMNRRKKNGKKRTLKQLVNGRLDVGFISGCRADQTSADTVINGRPCGAFTHYLIVNLNKSQQSATSETIAKETAKLLNSEGYDQVPQVDGPQKDKPFLS